MTYHELLEQNESRDGIDWEELTTEQLFRIQDEIPGWIYPLALDILQELERRTGITDPKGLMERLNVVAPDEVYECLAALLLPEDYKR